MVKVNVDVAGDISGKYLIQAMPTFHVVDTQGNSIFKVTGGSEKNVDDAIVKAKNHNWLSLKSIYYLTNTLKIHSLSMNNPIIL